MTIGLDLDQYQLKNRVLLVFAPTPDDVRYEEQIEEIESVQGQADDRDLLVFGIFERGPSFAEERAISSEESARARRRFDVSDGDFGLRLMGKDGTEILRSGEPLPSDDIFEAIDRTDLRWEEAAYEAGTGEGME
jgi:hypothetical protein